MRVHLNIYDSDLPVIGLRERCLLMPKQPSMGVGGMKDVDISPLQWSTRGSQWGRREGPLPMFEVTAGINPAGYAQ